MPSKNIKTIGFHGAEGANAHLACEAFYPGLKSVALSSFREVFEAVENGEVDLGMIPLENSYAGRVSEIHNLLHDSKVLIIAEHFFLVKHMLAGLKNSELADLKEVYSHPQALMQCQKNLRQLKIKPHPLSSTSAAARFIADQSDKSKAAICSKVAAETNGLKILKENIQDDEDNFTIFVAISNHGIDPDLNRGDIITTLLFTIRNIPGSLFKALGGFATNNVNIIKLESYIPGGFSNQAKFFISIEGHPNQKNVSNALEELGFFCKNVKLIGIYYADETRKINK